MISKVFADVKQHLETTLRDLGEALPDHQLGEENIATQGAPPRITWVVLGGPVKPTRQTGADADIANRQIATRSVHFMVHVWGNDFEATEVLANHFVAACRSELTAYPFRALSEDWMTGQAGRGSLGRLCKLEIEIDIPFTAEPIAVSLPPHTLTLNGTIPAQ